MKNIGLKNQKKKMKNRKNNRKRKKNTQKLKSTRAQEWAYYDNFLASLSPSALSYFDSILEEEAKQFLNKK